MTNNWSDIGNATCIIAWGANPAENHPACMAHINRARFPKQYFPGTPRGNNKTGAKLIVVDPRKTRTAAQADHYIRIRPGTDIALANGIVTYITSVMESATPQYRDNTAVPPSVVTAYKTYLNQTGSIQHFGDGAGGAFAGYSTNVGLSGSSKYSDARFVVNDTGTDYVRETRTANDGAAVTHQVSNVPKKAVDLFNPLDADYGKTAYARLKDHASSYDLPTVASICGCSVDEIKLLGDYMIQNSRCSSVGNDPQTASYRSMTLLYAMGITQHTCGSQNVKSFAVMQTLLGNMGRSGGGINALRGIHNVQGSTDMGLLYGNIPAYSGNPTVAPHIDPNAFGRYMDSLWGTPVSGTGGRASMNASYDDAYSSDPNQSFTTYPATRIQSLQQRGFNNMTLKWFGRYSTFKDNRAKTDAAYALWPKGNGDNHIQMFRNMGLPLADPKRVKAAVVWGQNPAVTEPNQGKVRDGLKNLDLLVCVDMFMNETAAVARRSGTKTYLIPAAAHVEKAGSATNSGRTLQWRYKANDPMGNSRDDSELLLRFAKALDTAGCFSHISAKWTEVGEGLGAGESVYGVLYGTPYGYSPGATPSADFKAAGSADAVTTIDYATPGKTVTDGTTYAMINPANATDGWKVRGSEYVAEKVYREMCTSVYGGGTIWIYHAAYSTARANANYTTLDFSQRHRGQNAWSSDNRSKARSMQDPNGNLLFPGWGYSWLVNRRVLYNNNPGGTVTSGGYTAATAYFDPATPSANHEVLGDVNDLFMGPDSCSRFFVSTNTSTLNYSRWYRTIHRMPDTPDAVLAKNTGSPHYVAKPGGGLISYAGRYPAHTEPYESPSPSLAAITNWGRNTKGTAAGDLLLDGTPVGDVTTYPLVLTTIRCVEHFQGGPITRNNWWNVETEPEPWIELNAVDARTYNIKDGDYVKIVTARTEGLANDKLEPYGDGFVARVGVGLQANQRVAPGVVAIPWHWGDKGLSTGSRANDLTIDAMDANTTIPEYKACLCRIEKM